MRYSSSKISLARKGVPLSDNHCQSLSRAQTGKTWWTNGIIQTKSEICPGDGFIRGRLNGSLDRDKNIYTLEHPNEGIVKITRKDFIKKYDLKAGNVSFLLNKKTTQYKGWTLLEINDNPV